MTPARAHAALADSVVRALAAGDVLTLQRLSSHDVVDHSALPGQPRGWAGLRERAMTLCASMPDCDVTVDVLSTAGDTVLARASLTAVGRGAPGVAPTVSQVTMVLVLRFAVDLLTELWTSSDQHADRPLVGRSMPGLGQRVGAF